MESDFLPTYEPPVNNEPENTGRLTNDLWNIKTMSNVLTEDPNLTKSSGTLQNSTTGAEFSSDTRNSRFVSNQYLEVNLSNSVTAPSANSGQFDSNDSNGTDLLPSIMSFSRSSASPIQSQQPSSPFPMLTNQTESCKMFPGNLQNIPFAEDDIDTPVEDDQTRCATFTESSELLPVEELSPHAPNYEYPFISSEAPPGNNQDSNVDEEYGGGVEDPGAYPMDAQLQKFHQDKVEIVFDAMPPATTEYQPFVSQNPRDADLIPSQFSDGPQITHYIELQSVGSQQAPYGFQRAQDAYRKAQNVYQRAHHPGYYHPYRSPSLGLNDPLKSSPVDTYQCHPPTVQYNVYYQNPPATGHSQNAQTSILSPSPHYFERSSSYLSEQSDYPNSSEVCSNGSSPLGKRVKGKAKKRATVRRTATIPDSRVATGKGKQRRTRRREADEKIPVDLVSTRARNRENTAKHDDKIAALRKEIQQHLEKVSSELERLREKNEFEKKKLKEIYSQHSNHYDFNHDFSKMRGMEKYDENWESENIHLQQMLNEYKKGKEQNLPLNINEAIHYLEKKILKEKERKENAFKDPTLKKGTRGSQISRANTEIAFLTAVIKSASREHRFYKEKKTEKILEEMKMKWYGSPEQVPQIDAQMHEKIFPLD